MEKENHSNGNDPLRDLMQTAESPLKDEKVRNWISTELEKARTFKKAILDSEKKAESGLNLKLFASFVLKLAFVTGALLAVYRLGQDKILQPETVSVLIIAMLGALFASTSGK